MLTLVGLTMRSLIKHYQDFKMLESLREIKAILENTTYSWWSMAS